MGDALTGTPPSMPTWHVGALGPSARAPRPIEHYTGCSCNDSLGRCAVVFWLAIIFSVIGMAIVLAGLVLMNSKFSDFLIYTGAIIMVFSLIWWLFWYMGNIEESDSQYESKQNFSNSNVENLGTNFWHPELRSHPKPWILVLNRDNCKPSPWCFTCRALRLSEGRQAGGPGCHHSSLVDVKYPKIFHEEEASYRRHPEQIPMQVTFS
uniref:Uncharacterized protein n=1 Tax=Eptatretus burgeri TaxID=7764 RepID=A0A8C4R0Z9_EPTBU